MTRSDALVLFGATGDLAFKKLFPAMYDRARRAQGGGPAGRKVAGPVGARCRCVG